MELPRSVDPASGRRCSPPRPCSLEIVHRHRLELVGEPTGRNRRLDDERWIQPGVADDIRIRSRSPIAVPSRLRYHSARPSRSRTPWAMPSPVNHWYDSGRSTGRCGLGPFHGATVEALGITPVTSRSKAVTSSVTGAKLPERYTFVVMIRLPRAEWTTRSSLCPWPTSPSSTCGTPTPPPASTGRAGTTASSPSPATGSTRRCWTGCWRPPRRSSPQPQEEKARIAMARGGRAWRGWFPLAGELTSGVPDRKEVSPAPRTGRATPARCTGPTSSGPPG